MVFRKNTVGSAKLCLSIGFASWVLSNCIFATAVSSDENMSKLEQNVSGVWHESNVKKTGTPRLRRNGTRGQKGVSNRFEEKDIDVQYFKEENYERFLQLAGQSFSAITSPPSHFPSIFPSKGPTASPTRSDPDTDNPITNSPTTPAPTPNPTTLAPTPNPTTLAPTPNPTTLAPTPNPTTLAPTPNPTTLAPTSSPTTSAPTPNPTTLAPIPSPTTASPTPNPTTLAPTVRPTTLAPIPNPTTAAPTPNSTPNPTTVAPTPNPTTLAPIPSPTTVAPTRFPTATPSASPSTSPSYSCPMSVDLDCRHPPDPAPNDNQISCAEIPQPPLSCTDATDVKLMYEENTCDGDASTNCTDYQCTADSSVRVICTGGGELFCNCTVEEGGFIVLTSLVILPNEMTCSVENANTGEVCQEVSFDSSGNDVGLDLGDRFGSLVVSSCTGEGSPEQNCIVDVDYYYTVRNDGFSSSGYLEITNFTRTCDGELLIFDNVENGPIGARLAPGAVGYLREESSIDVCRSVAMVKGVRVDALFDGNPGPCFVEDDLIIPVHPVAPTLPPVTPAPVTPAPLTAAPSPAPTTASPTASPTTAEPSSCVGLTVAKRRNEILARLGQISDPSLLTDSESAQYRASQWLIDFDDYQVCPSDDQELVQRYIASLLYYSLDGDRWNSCSQDFMRPCDNDIRWLSNTETCKWSGNQCYPISGSTKLSALGPDDNGASGSIPTEVSYLTELIDINLDDNNGISGPIPENIGNMDALVGLDLDNNIMTGTIPESIYDLPKLEYLDLNNNIFTGTISTEIGRLDLKLLQLNSNAFIGTIPSEIGLLNSLTVLTLDVNDLSGTIPSELNSAFDLQELTFSNNRNLNGTLPTVFGEFRFLESLRFSLNEFTGNIPTEYGQLIKLENLNFSGNKLGGKIPSELGLLVEATHLIFHNNDFTGVMPQEICDLKTNGKLDILTSDCQGLNPQIVCQCCDACFPA